MHSKYKEKTYSLFHSLIYTYLHNVTHTMSIRSHLLSECLDQFYTYISIRLHLLQSTKIILDQRTNHMKCPSCFWGVVCKICQLICSFDFFSSDLLYEFCSMFNEIIIFRSDSINSYYLIKKKMFMISLNFYLHLILSLILFLFLSLNYFFVFRSYP